MQYPLIDLDQWTSGRLSFAGEPELRIREQRGHVVSFRLEPLPDPGAALPFTQSRTIALSTSAAPVSIRRYPVTKLKLQIFYGAQEPASRELIVAPGPAG